MMPAVLALGIAAVNGGSNGVSAIGITGLRTSTDPIIPYIAGFLGMLMLFGFFAAGLLQTLWVSLAMKARETTLGVPHAASVGQRVRKH